MDEPKDQLTLRVRKLWVRWVLLTLTTPMPVAIILLLEKSLGPADALVRALVSVVLLIGLAGFILIIVTSVRLARTVGKLKNMSGVRRDIFAILLIGGALLIAAITVFAACCYAIGMPPPPEPDRVIRSNHG